MTASTRMTNTTWTRVIATIVEGRGWTLLDDVQIATSDDFFVLVKIPESGERWTRIDIPGKPLLRDLASLFDHVDNVFDHFERRIAEQREATKRWSPYPWSPHP